MADICPQCLQPFNDGWLVPVWADGKHFCDFICAGRYKEAQKRKHLPDALSPYSERSEAAYQWIITVIREAPWAYTAEEMEPLFDEFWAAREEDWERYYREHVAKNTEGSHTR